MADCPNLKRSLANCTCSATCGSKGLCCECLQNHIQRRQLPGCCFPPDAERTYDRSFEAFISAWNK